MTPCIPIGSNEYPKSMFLSRNDKNNVSPVNHKFYYIKVGFKGIKIIKACFRDVKCRGTSTAEPSWNGH